MKRLGRHFVVVTALLGIAMFVLAGCAAPATAVPPTPVPPTAVPPTAMPPTAAPTAAPTKAPAAPTAAPTAASANPPAAGQAVTLQVVQNGTLGAFLADGEGRSLYLYTKDTKNTSNCYDQCAVNWPALISSAQPTLKDGVTAGLLGTATRKDGSTQVTYNGWPLYYYIGDKKGGDTAGQAVGKVWWVISPEGNVLKPSGLKIAEDSKLGKFIADETGRSLYMYTKDTKDTSVCYDKCEVSWPPLLTTGSPVLADGVDSKLLGTTKRKDGSVQITYNGMPLYYYAPDVAPGDVKGQGVGTVWYVVTADGKVVQ